MYVKARKDKENIKIKHTKAGFPCIETAWILKTMNMRQFGHFGNQLNSLNSYASFVSNSLH